MRTQKRKRNSYLKGFWLTLVVSMCFFHLNAQEVIGSHIDGVEGEHLGRSIRINSDGTVFAVSSINHNQVKVFEWKDAGGGTFDWIQKGATLVGVANSSFGSVIDLDNSGDFLIIGAPDYTGAFGSKSGLVRVYHFNETTNDWVQIGDDIEGTIANEFFGASVSISKDASTFAFGGTGSQTVRIYSLNDLGNNSYSYSQIHSDVIGDIVGSSFGFSVSLDADGSHIAIGSYRENSFRGAAYIYQNTGNSWDIVGSKISSAEVSFFGYRIDINDAGDTVIVGAYRYNNNAGLVRVFSFNGTSWEQVGQDIVGSANSRMGSSVSINGTGNIIACGAINANSSGHVYIYENINNQLVLQTSAISGEFESDDDFGYSVSLSNVGDKLAVGVRTYLATYGRASIYQIVPQNWFTAAVDTDWTNPANWNLGRVPSTSDDAIINSGVSTSLNSNLSLRNLTILANGSLSFNPNGASTAGLTLSGNLLQLGSFTITNGNSLIVEGTTSGNLTYSRSLVHTNNENLSKNWYLVSSSFANETLENLQLNNSFASGSGSNIGIAYYNNNTGAWNYQNTSATGTISNATGMSIRLADSGTLSFNGTMNTNDVAIDLTNGTTNAFNLIGNPYPSYLPINDTANSTYNLFRANGTNSGSNDGNTVLEEDTVWLWNQATNQYDTFNLISADAFIAPGQGFFVKTIPGGGPFNFNKTMQSHRTTDTFQKGTTNNTPKISLLVSNGTTQKQTHVYYLEGATTDFDNGYDSSLFGAMSSAFEVYTRLVNSNSNKKLAIQSLPLQDYGNMVIPLGIQAPKDEEFILSLTSNNLPYEHYVYLEDRLHNQFVRLDAEKATYKTSLGEFGGEHRFYIHTSTKTVESPKEGLDRIRVYQANPNTIHIQGIPKGTSTVTMYSVLGKQLIEYSFENKNFVEFQIPTTLKGVYIMHIKNAQGTIAKKIFCNGP